MRRTGHTFLLCLACLCLGPPAGSAVAAPSVESSSLSLTTTQAGAHADLTVSLALEDPGDPETARDLRVALPPGYFPYPAFHVRCTTTQLGEEKCPVDSQVGIVALRGSNGSDPSSDLGTAPVHLLVPESGKLARLGFVIPAVATPVEVSATVSPARDHGLELAFGAFPEIAPLRRLDLTLWGVPADASHDELRFPLAPGGRPSGQPLVPFLRNPTSCGAPGSLQVEAGSYEDPGDFATASSAAPLISGCGKLAFDPLFDAELTSTESTAGLDLTLENPADMSPNGLSSSDAREIFVALPPQLELDRGALASAPSLGSFTASVLGIESPLEGAVHFDGAESADSYRLLLVGAGGGADLSIPAYLEYDAAFGSWALELPDLPQLPLEDLELQVASAAGPFKARECGSFEAVSELAPWSGRPPMMAGHVLPVSDGPGGGPCPVPGQKTAPSSAPPPPAEAPPPSSKPLVRLRRWPPPRTRDRTPTFGFTSSVTGSTFECKIDGRPLRRCKSPLTLPRLGFGRHVFKVRAVSPSGTRSFFAIYGFTVRR